MEIPAYLCLGGVIWVLVMVFATRVRQQMGLYFGLSFILSLAGLAGYILLSVWIGLLRFGAPFSRDVPQDYIARGLPGIAAMVIPLVGLASPIVVAWLLSRGTASSAVH